MILIINSKRRHAVALAEIFRIMGYLAYPILPSEIGSEMSLSYHAAILMEPESLPDPIGFKKAVCQYNSSLPLFALTEKSWESNIFNMQFQKDTTPAVLVNKISNYLNENGLTNIGLYRIAGIDASVSLSSPTYLGKTLGFTKTEAMILRYFAASYPNFESASQILKHSFRQSRLPDEGNVRTQISCMNKKFRELTGNTLTEFQPGRGYRILCAEIKKELLHL